MDDHEPARSPAEHAKRLGVEASLFERLFREPIRYYVRHPDGTEVEVSREAFFSGLRPQEGNSATNVATPPES